MEDIVISPIAALARTTAWNRTTATRLCRAHQKCKRLETCLRDSHYHHYNRRNIGICLYCLVLLGYRCSYWLIFLTWRSFLTVWKITSPNNWRRNWFLARKSYIRGNLLITDPVLHKYQKLCWTWVLRIFTWFIWCACTLLLLDWIRFELAIEEGVGG